MKRIREDVGAIKRMYVRPEFRGKGIGRVLVEALLAEAQQIGYLTVRLDSVLFMKAAHSLYRSAGFRRSNRIRRARSLPSSEATGYSWRSTWKTLRDLNLLEFRKKSISISWTSPRLRGTSPLCGGLRPTCAGLRREDIPVYQLAGEQHLMSLNN